jgi:hypothetical protein
MVLLTMMACNNRQKMLDGRITLWRKDKIPYGTFYAFENLKYIFPKAEITINKSSPGDYRSFSGADYAGEAAYRRRKKGYIIIAPQVLPDQREINAIVNFVGEGNQVFISSFHIGDSLLNSLKIKLGDEFKYFVESDSLSLSVYDPVIGSESSFTYPGLAADNFVSSLDSQYATILGRDKKGHPNFIKFEYKGGGAIFLHFAPMALTNFFLLHKNNKAYYDNVLSYLSSSLEEIKWDDYFRYPKGGNFSALQYVLSNRSLKWAFWLVLLLFAIIYTFESKRRQRLIPVIGTIQNSSLDFVKTIGRLYYQQKDHGNLAAKMTAHFLDQIRTKYNLPTSLLDDAFVDRLSYKSGKSREQIGEILTWIKMFQDSYSPRDEELLEFNQKIDAFFKQA